MLILLVGTHNRHNEHYQRLVNPDNFGLRFRLWPNAFEVAVCGLGGNELEPENFEHPIR